MNRVLRRAASVGVTAIVGSSALLGGTAAVATTTHAPYQDSSAVGYIGLCDRAGHQITQGNVHTKPLAFRAVSSEAAQAPYNNPGRTAILLAYQPREGLEPGEWSGDELTASTRYTNPQHPMTAATKGDDSLADFTDDFHPMWDGYIQLRMYLGAPEEQAYSLHYPALNLQITGDTWHAVGGGPVSCTSGKATSIESILLPKPTSKPHQPSAGSSTGPTKVHSKHPAQHTASPSSTAPGTTPAGTDAATASSTGSSNHDTLIVVLVLAGLLLITGVPLVVRRRRDPPPSIP